MSLLHQLLPIRFLLGAAVLTIGGAWVWGHLTTGSLSGQSLMEHMITSIGAGISVFVCAAGGYFLFNLVRQSRLRRFVAGVLFAIYVALCAFIPVLVICASRVWWPLVFRGSEFSGLFFMVALISAWPFLLVMLLGFIVGLVRCRPKT